MSAFTDQVAAYCVRPPVSPKVFDRETRGIPRGPKNPQGLK